MFGDSINILAGGFGGTSVTLKKINQDNYAAEYLHRDDYGEIRLKVRHTVESSIGGAAPLDRHNVEMERIIFADGSTFLEDLRRVYSVTIRVPQGALQSTTADWFHGLTYWLSGSAAAPVDTVPLALIGWES